MTMVVLYCPLEVDAMHEVMSAGEFKSRCLKVMDEVQKTGIEIVVTKRGRPVVRIVPIREVEQEDGLTGMILHQGDILSTDEDWEADG
jgi:prevent-host-death family protein